MPKHGSNKEFYQKVNNVWTIADTDISIGCRSVGHTGPRQGRGPWQNGHGILA